MKRAIYICGEPGSGKTTLSQALLERHFPIREEVSLNLVGRSWFHFERHPELDVWGRYLTGHQYPGTDCLANDSCSSAYEYLESEHAGPRIYFEGAKLGTKKMLHKLQDADYQLDIVRINVDPEVGEARRATRTDTKGMVTHATLADGTRVRRGGREGPQTDKYVNSIRKRVDNLCNEFADSVWEFNNNDEREFERILAWLASVTKA